MMKEILEIIALLILVGVEGLLFYTYYTLFKG